MIDTFSPAGKAAAAVARHIDEVTAAMMALGRAVILPRRDALRAHDDGLTGGQADYRTAIDLVTEVDVEVGGRLTTVLKDLFPDALVFDEEITKENPAILETYFRSQGRFAIMIDGVDGTNSYVHGDRPPYGLGEHGFATVVTFEFDHDGFAAVTYQPSLNRLLVAINGAVYLDRQKIIPPRTEPLEAYYDFAFVYGSDLPGKTIPPALKTAFPAAAIGYANQIAFKLCDRSICSAFGSQHQPWDIMPVAVVARNLGGCIVNFSDGAPYHPVTSKGHALLVSPSRDPAVIQRLLALHRPVLGCG